MTYIELYDEDSLENICACLAYNPCRVILLGNDEKLLQKHVKRYEEILNRRGDEAEFHIRTVNRNSLNSIVEVLSQIVEEYDDCVLDITGGGDLYLAAAGIVAERYQEKQICMQRFHPQTRVLYQFYGNGTEEENKIDVSLTVKENINIYGGDMVENNEGQIAFYEWLKQGTFMEEISPLWEVCKRNPKQWNAQVGVLSEINSKYTSEADDLHIYMNKAALDKQQNSKNRIHRKWLMELQKAGAFTSFIYDHDSLSLTYKNEQIKACLNKAGQVLELKVYDLARKARDKKGQKAYQDVETGVCIDWDGKEDLLNPNTNNEIDVMMMHGMIPVFVSCKNGNVGTDELYKLETVAKRFGGKYAKKILVATQLDRNDKKTKSLKQRALDMGIEVRDDFAEKSDNELERIVASFWK